MSMAIGSWEAAVLWLRAQPEMQDIVWSGYYDDPLLSAAARYRDSVEWAAVRGLLPEAAGERRALDVGAGRGIASYALARDGFKVTALEPDSSAVVGAGAIRRLAEEAGLRIDVIQESSEKLPLRDSEFDVVFARAVLHHTKSLEHSCREFFRVLKPGGRLLAIREHVISRPEDLAAFHAIHLLHRFYGGEQAFLLRTYLGAIRGAGFRIVAALGPFDSAINMAPNTPSGILQELADRVSRRNRALRSALAAASRVPGAWAVVRRLLWLVDNRPGRLYSFVAIRP